MDNVLLIQNVFRDNWNDYVPTDEEVSRAIQTLSPREEHVIQLLYCTREGKKGKPPYSPYVRHHNMTLPKVGEEFKVTRERIRQIELKALCKLRTPLKVACLTEEQKRH